MLPKKNRAGKKELATVFGSGKFFNYPNLTFKFKLNNNSNAPQISFIAPKTISKKAVKRNSLRRLGYLVLEKYINKFPAGLIGAFIFKKTQNDISILENEIKNILDKIN